MKEKYFSYKYLISIIILFTCLFIFSFPSLALIPGDFGSADNGPPDGVVDFEDLMIFALAYGSSEGDANWNEVCDIAGEGGSTTPDGVIDFEDLMIFAMHYGECECILPSAPTLSDPGITLPSPATYTISWSAVSGATSYKIQEDISPSFGGAQEYTVTSTSRSFSHTVTTTTTYYYRVAAVNDCGQGDWSNVEDIIINCILPSAPILSDPGITLPSPATYTVSWSAVSGATSYVIQEATSSDFTGGLQEYPLTDTSKSFSHIVSTCTTYYYRVAAVNDCGQSGWSNVEDIEICPCTLPSTPTLSDPGDTLESPANYTVSWSDESGSGATSYKIQEATSPDFSGAQEYTTTSTSKSFSHTVITTTTYYYRVAAVNDCGQSGWSNVGDIVINQGINIPTINDPGTSVSSGTSYTVTWSDESGNGATKYTLQENVLPDFSSAQNYVLTETSGSFSRIVDSDTTFYYRVRSENDTEQSDWSNTVDMLVTPISPPDTPVINDPGSSIPSGTSYTVTWSDESGSGANHYQLQEATTADFSGAQNYSLATTSKSFTHSTFEDTTYYYRVVAENTVSSQYSGWSNTVDITVSGEVPNTPTLNDPGTEVNSGVSYTITWSDESGSGAASYLLQEDTVDNFSSALSYTTSNNFKSITHSVLSDTTYYYRVAAVNSNGQSGWSTTKSKIVKAVELAEWTVMIYLNGDNALESQVWDDLTEMETVGSKNGVNIIAQMDYASSPGTYRYFVTGLTQGSSKPYYPDDIVASLGEQNMAEPAVLSDFVNWATLSYPANKYLLILRGTGEGWKGLLEDTTSSDKMTLEELVQGLSGINSHIDVLGLDASCMQMTEVVYAIGDGLISPPDYIVGSQEIVWDNGWDYYDILDDLTFDSTYDPAACAEALVYDIGVGNGSPLADTVSAICIPVFMSNAKTVLDDFGNALKNSAYSSNIAIVRALAQSFTGHPEFKDLCHFNELIWDYDVYDCYDQADLVFDFVWDYSNIIDYHSEGLPLKDCNGLSIYIPDTLAGYDTEYNVLQFAQDTLWDEFLQNITTVVKPTVTTIGHDSVTETSATCYGRINSTGGERVNRLGIEYQDLTSGGGTLDKYKVGDYGDEDFSRGLINLTAGHTYEYRAYADNPTAGRGYGEWKEFTTIPEDPEMPEVSTYDTDQIGSTTATVHGKINSTGGAIISERGFTYGLTDAANTWTVSETGSFGEGFFEMDLSGLEPSTTYYYKAFATNIVGTDYGPWAMFTTTEGTPDPDAPDTPTLYDPGTTVESGEQYVVDWSSVSGATSYILQEATQSNFSDAQNLPTTDTSMGIVHSESEDTTYYYRVAAVNSNGQSEWSDPPESIEVEKNITKYRALLVAIDDYPGTSDDLVASLNNLARMEDVFQHCSFGSDNTVFLPIETLTDNNATKDAILLDKINNYLGEADSNDISYFCFFGHGFKDEFTEEISIYVYDGLITVSELETRLNDVHGDVVVILQSCHSGGFIGKGRDNEEIQRELTSFNDEVINIFTSNYIKKDLTSDNKYKVLTACKANQLSHWNDDIPADAYGYFTKALSEGFGYNSYPQNIPADHQIISGNADGKVSLDEAYHYVQVNILLESIFVPLLENIQVYPLDSDFTIVEY